MLLGKEGPKNLFRILMTRDLDHGNLKGVVYDHACGLDQFILNREPARFEYLRTLGFINVFHKYLNNQNIFLVDGSHYAGHKKSKKG